ncbi:MAG: chemotaxis protein CheW [Burkholderiaceae bacterium]|jgi:twitching motility protein PilI|nr:chemotaxis protein CheW [Burkholderiaceae bacterium]
MAANKQALREFQSRLAQRLQSAQTAGVVASWLAVESGQRALLFPLSHAGEIFPWAGVWHVPHAQPWFLGVANLRGGLFGVVDLAEFLSAGDKTSPSLRTESDLAQCRLVVFNPLLEAGGALLIDRLMGLRTPDTFTRSEAPASDAPDYYGYAYIDAQGRRWQEINLQRLSGNPAFLGIGG